MGVAWPSAFLCKTVVLNKSTGACYNAALVAWYYSILERIFISFYYSEGFRTVRVLALGVL